MRSLAVLFLHLGWENLGLHPLITGNSAKLRSVFCSPKEDAAAGLSQVSGQRSPESQVITT
jgi:hypothetical protein